MQQRAPAAGTAGSAPRFAAYWTLHAHHAAGCQSTRGNTWRNAASRQTRTAATSIIDIGVCLSNWRTSEVMPRQRQCKYWNSPLNWRRHGRQLIIDGSSRLWLHRRNDFLQLRCQHVRAARWWSCYECAQCTNISEMAADNLAAMIAVMRHHVHRRRATETGRRLRSSSWTPGSASRPDV